MKPLKSLALGLLFVVGGGVLSAEAQDIITTKDAEEITAKVQTITPQGITYLKWDNLDGPTYFIDSSDVLFIKYKNGTKEVFTAKQSAAKEASAKAGTGGGLTAGGIKFQSDISLGTIFRRGLCRSDTRHRSWRTNRPILLHRRTNRTQKHYRNSRPSLLWLRRLGEGGT
ncbi:MAG: hypothetical protein L6V35_03795 [Alistipes putredinis]|nr:MAG: hypothetical protein L6V35_03795 [Alistipes putredinis]